MGVNAVTQNKYIYMIHNIMHDVPCARAAYIRAIIWSLSRLAHTHIPAHACVFAHTCIFTQTYMHKDTTIKVRVATW